MAGIELEIDEGVAVVRLARPERRNAVSLAMWQELPRMFKRLEEDERVRGIVLTGAGGFFSAGADISEFGTVRADKVQAAGYEVDVDACCDGIFATSKPTVAAIRGGCIGGACNLAMSCDFRFASPEAKFAIPAARLSIVYGVKGTQRLLALVGLANAKRIFYSAETCGAREAQRIGLVDRVDADPLAEAKVFLKRVGRNAPLSIAGAKFLLNGLATGAGALDPTLADVAIDRAASSEDYRESVKAFAAKREPRFLGR